MIEAVSANVSAVQPAALAAGQDMFSGVLAVVLSGLAAGAAHSEVPEARAGAGICPGEETAAAAAGGPAAGGENAGAVMALVSGFSFFKTAAAAAAPGNGTAGAGSAAVQGKDPLVAAAGSKKDAENEASAIMALVSGLSFFRAAAASAVPEAATAEAGTAAQEQSAPYTPGAENAVVAKKAGESEAAAIMALVSGLAFARTCSAATPVEAGNSATGPAVKVGSGKTGTDPAGSELKGAAVKSGQADISAAAEVAAAAKDIPAAPAPVNAAAAAAKEIKNAAVAQPAEGMEFKGLEKAAPAAQHIAAQAQAGAENTSAQSDGNKNSQLPQNGKDAASAVVADEAAQAPAREIAPEKSAGKSLAGSTLEAAVSSGDLRLYPRAAKAAEAAGSGLSAAGVEKIAAAADRLESAGKGKISLEINEPGLGKVRVDMAISGSDLNISLEVANKEAGKFLSAKVPELMEALSQRGLNSGVELFAGSDGGGREAGSEERPPQRRFAPAVMEIPEQELPVQEEGRISLYA